MRHKSISSADQENRLSRDGFQRFSQWDGKMTSPMGWLRVNFRNSLIGKIFTANKPYGNQIILNNSRLVRWLISASLSQKAILRRCAKTSKAMRFSLSVVNNIVSYPIKTASGLIVSVILADILLCISYNIQAGALGWLVRILFLTLGLGGLFCHAGHTQIKQTSLLLRHLQE